MIHTLKTGDAIQLRSPTCNFGEYSAIDLIIDVKSGGKVTLARPSQPYHLLTVSEQSLETCFTSTTSKRGQVFDIILISHSDAHHMYYVRIRCFAHSNISDVYLTFQPNGTELIASRRKDEVTPIAPTAPNAPKVCAAHDFILQEVQSTKMTIRNTSLCKWQQDRFVLEGYLLVPAVVNMELCDACLRLINSELGTVGALTAGGLQFNKGKLSGLASNHSSVRDLVRIGCAGLLGKFS